MEGWEGFDVQVFHDIYAVNLHASRQGAVGDPDGPLNLMNRVGAGCISRILSGSGGILEEKT